MILHFLGTLFIISRETIDAANKKNDAYANAIVIPLERIRTIDSSLLG